MACSCVRILLLALPAAAFVARPAAPLRAPRSRLMMARPAFEVSIPLGDDVGVAQLKFDPVCEKSEVKAFRYGFPFKVSIENVGGLPVCTKTGEGGEREGDILRYSTQCKMGLPQGDGLVTTAASFSGAIGWNVELFDTSKARSMQELVDAITSNQPGRIEKMILIFERPIEDAD